VMGGSGGVWGVCEQNAAEGEAEPEDTVTLALEQEHAALTSIILQMKHKADALVDMLDRHHVAKCVPPRVSRMTNPHPNPDPNPGVLVGLGARERRRMVVRVPASIPQAPADCWLTRVV
jgi:hypothetical protein